jgi:hypothetical protein
MPLKKSELYSSLWASCDELRGSMDASQYKDYVLVLLFVKYVSDKCDGIPYAPITIPPGSSFKDMVALKGKPTIGDDINKKILAPLASANKLSDMPDFNDPSKLGSGKEMVDRLTSLILIFENRALDFSKNRAGDDDLLGDAYEYLMRHFATESGKSKGQFYTPAEVSRIMAQILGIQSAETTTTTTVYDPTCGSGSLLLKVGDAARTKVTLYGQEKDASTAGLARMNMILHDNPTAVIWQGNTLSSPHFTGTSGQLKTFDYVVANSATSDGATVLTRQTTPTVVSSTSASRLPDRATTPTCSTSCAPSRAPAREPASCPTACSSAAMPRPTSAATLSARATSRASSACLPTSSTAPASQRASMSSTRRMRICARASSWSMPARASSRTVPRTDCASRTSTGSSMPSPSSLRSRSTPAW